MTSPRIARHGTRKIEQGIPHEQDLDELAVEEPLEVRVNDEPVVVTMRTPGEDFDLAAGFLFTEGILKSPDDIGALRYCQDEKHPDLRNIVNVTPAAGVSVDLSRLKRNFYATSSCGICGKAAIENIKMEVKPTNSKLRLKLEFFYSLGQTLRKAQTVFERTGGLHAAGIFDAHGTLLVLREDIGRHNATDKAIGSMFLNGRVPLDRHILMVSGRASFEIMQKAMMAGISAVCAVSAPSSLAVEIAQQAGMTLVGFLRADAFNIYTGAEHIEV
ncbi:MAG: formate dehydrogenase accessory sulfurtransferase FdhD [Planctomycetes bacterium]|nr:formate dehydrogenase accessory sulfurtransferase FdhD [Planctomycetota bacterium]